MTDNTKFEHRSLRRLMVLAAILILCVGCSDSGPSSGSGFATQRLTITGSSTLAPLIAELGVRFEATHPGTRIDVQTGGSSRGIRDTQQGLADLGMSSRSLHKDESTKLKPTTVAWDGVTFVVHRDNPVSNLSKSQLVSIYTGESKNWQQVSGLDAPIIVSSRAAGRSELELISRYLGIQSVEIAADLIDGETQQSIKSIANNKNAITFTSIGAAQLAVQSGEPIKLLPLDSVPAQATTVQSGVFPVARPLLLVRPKEQSNPLAEQFMKFAQSQTQSELVSQYGYVPNASL